MKYVAQSVPSNESEPVVCLIEPVLEWTELEDVPDKTCETVALRCGK